MKIPFKVVCLNDLDRPETIPTSKWVKKGDTYTVIKVDRIGAQGGKMGFQLAEIDLSGCIPYLYFGAWRFGIPVSPEALVESNSKVEDEELVSA